MHTIALSLFLTPLALTSVASGALVTVPYLQDFGISNVTTGGVVTATGITQSQSGYLSIVGAPNAVLQAQIAGVASASGSMNTGITGPNNFTISTQIAASNLTQGSVTNMVFALHAAGNSIANTYRLNIDFLTGTVGLSKASDALTEAVASGTIPSLAVGSQLAISLSGLYLSATEVQLTGTVSNGTNTYTVTYTDSSSIYAGEYYGFSNNKGAGSASNSTFGVRMDNFSLDVVPESSSSLLAATGLSAFLMRRRRTL